MDDLQDITTGSQLLSVTGRIWTVRTVTRGASRLVLTSDEPDGRHAIVVDAVATRRMVRIDQAAARTADDGTVPVAASDLIPT